MVDKITTFGKILNAMTKFLVIGTGGGGGSIAAFLALAGKDVTCIARGEHLRQIRQHGLHLKSDIKGEHYIKVKACTAEEYNDVPDVAIVTIKGYSIDETSSFFNRIKNPRTLFLPLLNVYGTGPRIAATAPGAIVLDGLIYIVGFISAPGEITQMGSTFKIIFGARPEQGIDPVRLETISKELEECDIHNIISDDINRDTFIKWSFISAMSCTGAYFDIPMGPIQNPGKEREFFANLVRESTKVGEAMGINFGKDLVEANLRIIDGLDPLSTASMQKDLARHHQSEIDGQLFKLADLAHQFGIKTPTYDLLLDKFGHLRNNIV